MAIKVISLNLWWGGELFPAIIEFLKAQAADIVLLQEVHNGHDAAAEPKYRSLDFLQEQLGYPYQDFAQMYVVNQPPGPTPLGTAVLAKFPVAGRSVRFFVEGDREIYDDVPEQWPIFPRLLQHCRLDTPASELNVFNMHGVWDLDGDNFSASRRRMSRIIIEATSGLANVILAGDSNAKRTNPAMRAIEKHLRPVFGDELKTTFNMRRKANPGYRTAAVDLMYVSSDIKVASKSCPVVDISDHLPLVVTLEVRA